MKKIYAECGAYYTNVSQKDLVRVIGKATDTNGENPIVIYCLVGKDGVVTEPIYMAENDFIAKYVL